ncbi:MAG: hypothetical protein HQ498_08695 [Pseudohongiella sp.]|nr:hypothetical protein [Pseudohongiella sp.]
MNTRKSKAQIPRFQPLLELPMFKRPNAFGIALAIFLNYFSAWFTALCSYRR